MKHIFFGLGSTGSGKSTTIEALKNSVEGYMGTMNAESFAFRETRCNEAANNRWMLVERHQRIVTSNELKTGSKLDGNIIKKISSGNDTIVARTHCKEETEFTPHFSCILMANDITPIVPYDDAVDNRVRIISYDKTFVDTPSNEFEIAKDSNLEFEMKTAEFKYCLIHVLLMSYKTTVPEPAGVELGKKQ